MLAAGTIIIPFLLSRWPRFGNQDISTFERKWKGTTEQKEKESGSRFPFWWKWNVFNGEQEGGREGAGWTFTIPHPRGGGIENRMPQSAGCKLLRRLCANMRFYLWEVRGQDSWHIQDPPKHKEHLLPLMCCYFMYACINLREMYILYLQLWHKISF